MPISAPIRGGAIPAAAFFRRVPLRPTGLDRVGQRVYLSRVPPERMSGLAGPARRCRSDVIVPSAPDSAIAVALGYAQARPAPTSTSRRRDHCMGRISSSPTSPPATRASTAQVQPGRSIFKEPRSCWWTTPSSAAPASAEAVHSGDRGRRARTRCACGSAAPSRAAPATTAYDTPDAAEPSATSWRRRHPQWPDGGLVAVGRGFPRDVSAKGVCMAYFDRPVAGPDSGR